MLECEIIIARRLKGLAEEHFAKRFPGPRRPGPARPPGPQEGMGPASLPSLSLSLVFSSAFAQEKVGPFLSTPRLGCKGGLICMGEVPLPPGVALHIMYKIRADLTIRPICIIPHMQAISRLLKTFGVLFVVEGDHASLASGWAADARPLPHLQGDVSMRERI